MDPHFSREPRVNAALPAATSAHIETPRAKWTKSYERERSAGGCRSDGQVPIPLNSQRIDKSNVERNDNNNGNDGNKIAVIVQTPKDPRLAQIKVPLKPEENARGVKRNRGEVGGTDETRNNNSNYEREEHSKRSRGECYRCGGRNHIVLVCTSTERDAYKNVNLTKCSACNGRGHEAANCPTVVNANPCYNCRQQGHFARDCPYNGNGNGNGNNFYPTRPKSLIYEYKNNADYDNNNNYNYNSMPRLNQTIVSQLRQYGYSSPAQLYAAINMSNVPNGNVPAPTGPYLPPPRGYVTEHPAPAPALNNEYRNAVYGNGTQYSGEGPIFKAPRVVQSGKCFRCGREDGHWTRDCPQRPADADPNGCYKCGKQGHKSRWCKACYRCGGEDGHRASECTK